MARRLDKPIRLYVLAIFIVVAYGLMPLVSVFPFTGGFLLVGPRFLPFNGSIQVLYGSDGDISLVLLVVTLVLCLFSAGSAIVAFLGISEGRTAALIFVTLDVIWWFFLVIVTIVENQARTLELLTQLIFPPLWLTFVWWNFTRPDIGAYYKQQAELAK